MHRKQAQRLKAIQRRQQAAAAAATDTVTLGEGVTPLLVAKLDLFDQLADPQAADEQLAAAYIDFMHACAGETGEHFDVREDEILALVKENRRPRESAFKVRAWPMDEP